MRSSRGFTLAELLVVVGIFALLVSLTVPSYIATRPQRLLNGETNRLASVVRQGRLFALRDNEKTYLEFIPEIDTYRLWTESGWRAYRDPINHPDEIAGRNPEFGDYDGDLDGDGDYYWDGGSGGNPEDPDVINDPVEGWIYVDTDGTYLDPDVLLMPTYPGNQPIRTVSPKLRIITDGSGGITNITRDFTDTRGVGGDNIVPFEVDIRMRGVAWQADQPIGVRNGLLSHFPLIFLTFFPDGTVSASWDNADSTNFDDEVIDILPGGLGATQIHLQVRGSDYNVESHNLFDPTVVIDGDEGSSEPWCPYNTLSLEDSNAESLGRTVNLNNLSGRIIIRDFAPIELDRLYADFGIAYY